MGRKGVAGPFAGLVCDERLGSCLEACGSGLCELLPRCPSYSPRLSGRADLRMGVVSASKGSSWYRATFSRPGSVNLNFDSVDSATHNTAAAPGESMLARNKPGLVAGDRGSSPENYELELDVDWHSDVPGGVSAARQLSCGAGPCRHAVPAHSCCLAALQEFSFCVRDYIGNRSCPEGIHAIIRAVVPCEEAMAGGDWPCAWDRWRTAGF